MPRHSKLQDRIGVSRVLGIAGAICVLAAPVTANQPARAAFPSDLEEEVAACLRGAPAGLRCETRNWPREVSHRNFVIDRVTECRPLTTRTYSGRPTPRGASEQAPALEGGDETTARSLVLATERVVRWSSDRSRLSNAQYDRSLNAMHATRVRSTR